MASSKERIEKAKKAYGIAEGATDHWLQRLVDSRWTLGIILASSIVIVVWRYW